MLDQIDVTVTNHISKYRTQGCHVTVRKKYKQSLKTLWHHGTRNIGIFGQNSIIHPQCSFLKILLLTSSCPRWPQPSVTSAAGWCPLCEPCCVATPVTNRWSTTAALSIVRVPRAWNPGWFMTASLYHGPWFKLRGDQVAMARESMRIQEMAIFHLANSSVFARAQTIFCCKPKANLGDGFNNVFIFI